MDQGDITSEKMLTVPELSYTVDSLQKNYNKDVVSFADNLTIRNDNLFNKKPVESLLAPPKKDNHTKGQMVINTEPK